jgi:hypothetical protein
MPIFRVGWRVLMTTVRLTGTEQQEHAIQLIRQTMPDGKWVMTLEEIQEKRRDRQNRLSFAWYRDLGKLTGAGEIHERCTCKLEYGIPILLGRDGNLKAGNEQAADYEEHYAPLPYETRLILMKDFRVTSVMSVKQFAEYLNIVQQESTQNHGIQLQVITECYDAL